VIQRLLENWSKHVSARQDAVSCADSRLRLINGRFTRLNVKPYAARAEDSETIPTEVGPFLIDGILGRGGMGIVYSAIHTETGARAAVKTLHGSARHLLSAIRREIHSLQRLDHDSVVRILDHGASDGVPWYAMELLRGRTLREHLAVARPLLSAAGVLSQTATAIAPMPDKAVFSEAELASERRFGRNAPQVPMRSELLRIVRRACGGLAHVHASGVVHRDLKPENVFIRENGSPVLVDFGIAARFGGTRGREILDANSAAIGTVTYMAPEQIRGEFVDARSDLYSLGCILYECLTGLPPFAGVPPSGILQAHLYQAPPPPSELAEGVSSALDRLVLRLLQKEPSHRLGYVDDVALALDAELQNHAREEPSSPRPSYIYRPPFVGRERHRQQLFDAVRGLSRDGKGGHLYLTGESGVGKTRLAMEAAREATRQGLNVVLGACGVDGPGNKDLVHSPPLAAFAPALLAIVDHCRECGAAESERILGARAKLLVAYQPAISTLPEFSGWPEPLLLTATAARARVLSALTDSLFAYVQVCPTLLVIDDLQWADELSKTLLAQLSCADLESHELLILATFRAEEASEELRALAKHSVLAELDRFGDRDVSAMAEGMLGARDLSPSLLAFLHSQSGGNPFFVVEYLRAAIDGGALTRDDAAGWRVTALDRHPLGADGVATAFPASLAALLERRVRDLDESAHRLLRGASVLGREFDGDVLLAWSALAPAIAMDALDELRRRHILEETDAGQLRFIHDRLRSAAYETIAARDLPGLHHQAAIILERSLPSTPSVGYQATLAAHWSRAQSAGKARHYYQTAAEHAKGVYAHLDALSLYQSCLRETLREATERQGTGDPAQPTWWIHEALGEIYSLIGRRDEAKAAYDQALLESDSAHARARLWRRIGKTYETQHLHDEALSAYSEAGNALGDPPVGAGDDWWSEWIGLQIDRVMVHYWLAREAELAKLVEGIRAVVREHGTPQQRAQLFKGLAYMNLRRERYALSTQTVAYAEQRLEASRDWGDGAEILEARFMLAMALLCHGALDRAEYEIIAALPEAERRGDVTILCRFLAYLTVTKRRRRDLDATRDSASKCLEVATTGSFREYVGAARANLGWVAWRRGDRVLAAQECRAALEEWNGISFVYPFEWLARLVALALELLPGGDPQAVISQAQKILDPKQQLLPTQLARALGRLATLDPVQPVTILGTAVLALAEQAGFL